LPVSIGSRFLIITTEGVFGDEASEEAILDAVPLRARPGIIVEDGAVEGGVG